MSKGNDFLPHLPSLSIREGGLELLFNLYRRVLPTLGGYLTEDGNVALDRVDVMLSTLGTVEDEVFKRRKALEDREKIRKEQIQQGKIQSESKRQKLNLPSLAPPVNVNDMIPLGRNFVNEQPAPALKPISPPTSADNKSAAATLRAALLGNSKETVPALAPAPNPTTTNKEDEGNNEEDEKEEEGPIDFDQKLKQLKDKRTFHDDVVDKVRLGEDGWKERYYVEKFGEEDGRNDKFIWKIVESYVQGLCWVFSYYYQGCQSWKWFYPYHYAPFGSDFKNIENVDISWAPSKPFKPFEQLMAVLPPQSASALPEPCRWYMTDKDSPINDFYPMDFKYDPNGKGVRWLWVARLPFIDESRLLKISEEVFPLLTDDEKRRNGVAPDLLFVPRMASGARSIQEACKRARQWNPGSLPVTQPELNISNTPTTAGDVRGGGAREIYGSAEDTGGISGFFLPPPTEYVTDLDQLVIGPTGREFESGSFICEFRLPPMQPHLCRLLPGLELPMEILDDQDLDIRRPRLSGMDVSTLLEDSSASRTGERSWGSSEPAPIVRNPFMMIPPPNLSQVRGYDRPPPPPPSGPINPLLPQQQPMLVMQQPQQQALPSTIQLIAQINSALTAYQQHWAASRMAGRW